MADRVLLDNDVAMKIACYALVGETLAVTSAGDTPPAMLGVGRFVIRGLLDRASNIVDVARAKTLFEQLLAAVQALEPSEEELALAADLEAEANHRDLELDGGESQLLAILAKRDFGLLITGDKRAIAAISIVATAIAAKRVACLEQLVREVVDVAGCEVVRGLVCSEPAIDKAVTACFGCTAGSPGQADIMDGLASYIGHLDKCSPGVLMPGFGGLAA